MRTAVLIVALLLLEAPRAAATSYTIAPAYGIACLDLATGKKIWEREPGLLPAPKLQIVSGKLLVTAELPGKWSKTDLLKQFPGKPVRYLLDPDTGRVLSWSSKILRLPVQSAQLEQPKHLRDADGHTYQYDDGDTHDLVTQVGTKQQTVLVLEDFIHALNLFGNLALFNFARGYCCGGEVYAYDVKHQRLAWEFDAGQSLPGLAERNATAIAVIDQRVYASVDQVVFALDPATGKPLWQSKLPRQVLASHDGAWATFAPVNNQLLVWVYHRLFLLDPRDGRLIWSFDAGWPADPQPLVYGNRIYLATLGGEEDVEDAPPAKPMKITSALRITKQDSGFVIAPMSRRDVPPHAELWWSLRPPLPPIQKGRRIVLTLSAKNPGQLSPTLPIRLELSEPLTRQVSTYVKFSENYNQAVLTVDGQVVAKQEW